MGLWRGQSEVPWSQWGAALSMHRKGAVGRWPTGARRQLGKAFPGGGLVLWSPVDFILPGNIEHWYLPKVEAD